MEKRGQPPAALQRKQTAYQKQQWSPNGCARHIPAKESWTTSQRTPRTPVYRYVAGALLAPQEYSEPPQEALKYGSQQEGATSGEGTPYMKIPRALLWIFHSYTSHTNILHQKKGKGTLKPLITIFEGCKLSSPRKSLSC